MIARFALSLSTEGIQLLHRVEGGWIFVGDVALDHPDLKTALADLRACGEELAGGSYSCKIVLPNDQIRYLSLIEHHVTEDRVRDALEGSTPYAVDDLSYDWREIAGHTFIAAVARETLDEADQFTRSHGFTPHSFTAIPEAFTFDGEPFFGAAKDVPDAARDSNAIHVIGVADASSSDPEGEAEPKLSLNFDNSETAGPASENQLFAEDMQSESSFPEQVETPKASPVESADEPISKKIPESLETLHPIEDTSSLADADAEPNLISEVPDERSAPDLLSLLISPDPSYFVIPDQAHHEKPAIQLAEHVLPEPALSAASEFAEPSPAVFETKPSVKEAGQSPFLAVAPAALAASHPVAGSTAPAITSTGDAPIGPTKQAPAVAATLDPKPLFPEETARTNVRKWALPVAAALVVAVGAGAAVWLGSPTADNSAGAELASSDQIAIPVAIPTETAPFPSETQEREEAVSPALAGAVAGAIADLAAPEAPEETTAPETAPLIETTAPAESTSPQIPTRTEIARPGASPQSPMTASDVRRLVLSTPEAERRHIATGVWQKAPRRSPVPVSAEIGDPRFPLIASPVEPPAARPELTTAVILSSDLPMPVPMNPPAPTESFVLDDRGFVEAAPDGAVTPDGVVVYAGAPPVIPPLRRTLSEQENPEDTAVGPSREAATPGGVSLEALASDARPRLRPAALPLPLTEGPAADPETSARLRPQARPEDLASRRPDTPAPGAVASALETALTTPADPMVVGTAQAVTRSLRPSNRPANLAARRASVAAAAPTPAPAPAPAPPVPAPQVAQPSGPTSTTVARGATIDNAINLRRVNLIGVYGRPNARSALVRLPNGRFMKVQPGDRLDGGRVAAIGESQLSYVKRGRTIVLDVPSG
ncbi:hypothetical protein AAD018_012620 [Aestuariibius insulae]|uniref:hypothetical protein n=1 Tax=Aestuariibius insulae TaxID=2058287 RepID=UPI00345E4E45